MKKIIAIIVSIFVILLGVFGTYSIFFKQDKDTTLTLIEKQWIEDNKNQIIDLSIVNNIPVFNYEGTGVIFDFVNELEEKTGLEFNKIPFSLGNDVSSEYSFNITNQLGDNQLLVYEDHYAIVCKEKMKYNNLLSIGNITLGVLEGDLDNINYYLQENKNIKFITYKDIKSLISAVKENKFNAIALAKTIYLDEILENDLNINYNITEVKANLVLQLGNNDRLNTIISKYFNKWYLESYSESYGENLTAYYFDKADVDDDSKVAFTSKQYKYGFISYAPYDKVIKNKLVGINNSIISAFQKI